MIITSEYQEVLNDLNNKNPLFVTGKAGTGKSTLIQHIVDTTNKNIVVLAPTGVAALNVNGQTIHSFFQIPPKIIEREQIKRIKSGLIKKVDIIIIDEISMVRADLMDTINLSLQLNTRVHDIFGGIKIIFVGDLTQLPPVIGSKTERQYINNKYNSPYFLSADCLKNQPKIIELTHIFRQMDEDFINHLNNIRLAENLKQTLPILNNQIANQKDSITLTPTRRKAEEINKTELQKLNTQQKIFEGTITGKFNIQEDNLPSPKTLILKEGSKIMFTRNDKMRRWVNGSLGTVKKITDSEILVETSGKEYPVQKVTWETIRYRWNGERISTESVGSYTQYPLILSWAITIHKSQGKTYESVTIDVDTGAFAEGQIYVALSRCKTLDGICLKTPLIEQDIIINPRIKKFYKILAREKEKQLQKEQNIIHGKDFTMTSSINEETITEKDIKKELKKEEAKRLTSNYRKKMKEQKNSKVENLINYLSNFSNRQEKTNKVKD